MTSGAGRPARWGALGLLGKWARISLTRHQGEIMTYKFEINLYVKMIYFLQLSQFVKKRLVLIG